MSTETQNDEYGTIDEALQPRVSEEKLAAAQDEHRSEVEFDDTPGTMAVAGVTTDEEGQPLPETFSQDEQQVEIETDETESPADAYPDGEDDAAPGGDGPEQEAQDSVEFDAALLQAAGLEESQARAQFGTPEALENALRLADINAVRWAQQQQQSGPQFTDPLPFEQQPAQPQQPVQQQEQPDAQAELITEEELELPELPDGEEWDDETVAVVQTLADHFNKKFQAAQQQFEAQLNEQGQATQAWMEERAQETLANYVAEFDGFVNELGDEWTDILGKGDGPAMAAKDPNSLHVQNRVHLDTVSRQLEAGRQAQGLPPIPKAQLLERALRVAFPQNQEQTIRKEVESKVAKRQRLKTNRPGNTIRKQPSAEDAAVARAEKFYEDRGLAADAMDDLEYDEI